MMEYLTRWAKAQLVKDCSIDIAAKFIFEFVLSMFGCLKILMSDIGPHFLNETNVVLTKKFQMYHPQANGTVEAFNKILENSLTKVCNFNRNDWYVYIPTVLWAYRTIYNKLTGKTPFRLVYGQEAVMPLEYIVPSLRITIVTEMEDCDIMKECLT